LAIFHRHFLYGKNAKLQHIFFILCGVGIGVFNYSKNHPVEDAKINKITTTDILFQEWEFFTL
jgi:hypothetical protein